MKWISCLKVELRVSHCKKYNKYEIYNTSQRFFCNQSLFETFSVKMIIIMPMKKWEQNI